MHGTAHETRRDYWEARLSRHFSLDGVGYLGLGESFNIWMYRVRRALFVKRVRPLVQDRRPLEVLDVGSGTGFYVERWRELGATSIVGSDLTETVVGRLQAQYPENEFIRADVGEQDPPLPARLFDAISAFDVLYHVVDDERYERAFANLAERLKPGGLLLFTEFFLHGSSRHAPTEVDRSLTDIEGIVRRLGLEVLARRPVFVLMNNPVDSPSRVHRLWWQCLEAAARLDERVGWVLGATLFRLEIALATRLGDGPSTEMMVCRRPVASAPVA